jgi:hypothetical protein
MQLKRLIKTIKKIEPYKIYQIEDGYIAELNDVEVYRTKHQHLCTSYCEIKLAEQRNLKNQIILQSISQLKAQGIL